MKTERAGVLPARPGAAGVANVAGSAMPCPLSKRAQLPECHAVAGRAEHPPREIVAAFCRGRFGDCPGYRYVRATGRALHPADFRAWVILGLDPGQTDPSEPAPETP